MKLSCVSFVLAMMVSSVVGDVADDICADAPDTKSARNFCYKAVALGCHRDNTLEGCAHRQRLFEKKSGTPAPWLSWTPPAVEEEEATAVAPPPQSEAGTRPSDEEWPAQEGTPGASGGASDPFFDGTSQGTGGRGDEGFGAGDISTCFTGTAESVFEHCKKYGLNCCNSANATDHNFACGGWGGQYFDDIEHQVEVTVCADSCNGKDSCQGLHKDMYVKPSSCNGFESCYQIGHASKASASITIEAQSCVGDLACKWVGYNSTEMSVGPNACHGGDENDGFRACAFTSEYSEDNKVMIGEGSCIGQFACRSVQQYTDGDILIGKSSCTGPYACYGVASEDYDNHRDIRNVAIADNACRGTDACDYLGGYADSVTVESNACVGYQACRSAGAGVNAIVSIGAGACVGHESCEQSGNWATTFTVGAGACIGDHRGDDVEDESLGRSCAELAENARHMSNVAIGANACVGNLACEKLAHEFDLEKGKVIEETAARLDSLEILTGVCSEGEGKCRKCLTAESDPLSTEDLALDPLDSLDYETLGPCEEFDERNIVLVIEDNFDCSYNDFLTKFAVAKKEGCGQKL